MNLEKHHKRCRRWPTRRISEKADLLIAEICSLHDNPRSKRLAYLRQVESIYTDEVVRRSVARLEQKRASYDARWNW